jgi:nucleotide-binding universal stress UspA family protein
MFKRILFPTKFEEFSLDILRSICCLKSGGLEDVVLLHVIDTSKLYTEAEWGIVLNLTRIQETAAARLASYEEYLQSEGIKVRTVITVGPLVSEIDRISQEEQVSLIVAGRQKRSILGELFVGSTTDRIIRKATMPVLVAKYHTVKEIEGELVEQFCLNMFRKILFPVDWSAWTERTKEYLPLLRQAGASEIVIVHVVENLVIEAKYMTEKTQEMIGERMEKLESLKQELQASGFQAKAYLLERGRAYREINRIATEEGVSMIVMGSHGKGFVEETLWGSVSQRVVEYSEKPVLVVK